MAMTPQERQEFNQLKTLVQQLLRVENVEFIKNVERRVVLDGVTTGTPGAATSINQAVNEGGSATYNVAADYDAKVPITLSDGTTRFIGVYNS